MCHVRNFWFGITTNLCCYCAFYVAPSGEPFLFCDERSVLDVENVQIILIPYIEQEDGAAEVWIGRYDQTAYAHVDIPLLALANFAGRDMRDREGIQEHCDGWNADRILLPTDETPPRWTAYTIASVLAGQREEAD